MWQPKHGDAVVCGQQNAVPAREQGLTVDFIHSPKVAHFCKEDGRLHHLVKAGPRGLQDTPHVVHGLRRHSLLSQKLAEARTAVMLGPRRNLPQPLFLSICDSAPYRQSPALSELQHQVRRIPWSAELRKQSLVSEPFPPFLGRKQMCRRSRDGMQYIRACQTAATGVWFAVLLHGTTGAGTHPRDQGDAARHIEGASDLDSLGIGANRTRGLVCRGLDDLLTWKQPKGRRWLSASANIFALCTMRTSRMDR